jgi:hypothetical protein
MTDDPNRKSLRQFQCRDYLWELFEQMSQDLECSVDYLVNESMRHYARSQGKLRQTMAPGNGPPMRAPNPPTPQGPPMPPPSMGVTRPQPGAMGQGPRPPGPGLNNPNQRPMQGGFAQPVQQQQQQQRPAPPVPVASPPTYGAPQPRMPQPPAYPGNNSGSVLYAVFEGQKYPIVKDEFYIGRSNKSCDLIVRDPNVSRQHARVVRHQGQFWMVDMGSTNGIEFQGTRVDRRPIGEGDVFRVCDHEIVFTYR